MASLIELAQRHAQSNGMTATEAASMLEGFARGAGRDLSWNATTAFLTEALAARIDKAAIGWMMAHKATEQEGEPQ